MDERGESPPFLIHLSRFTTIVVVTTRSEGLSWIIMMDKWWSVLGTVRINSVEQKNQHPQLAFWAIFHGDLSVWCGWHMVIILVSICSLLPPQTMHRVIAASFFFTLDSWTFPSKVDIFHRIFMIFNWKSIGWLPSQQRQSSRMPCTTRIRPRNVWMCRDARAIW